jgi:DmsE family decaheme c-type cytochrome
MAGSCAAGQTAATDNKQKGTASPEQEKAASEGPKTYAGSEICQGCHEDIFKAFQRNRHHSVEVDKKRGWSEKACEACHGPASKHVESMSAADIVNPSKIPAKEADRDCLKCHYNQPTHLGRIQGGHGRNEVACVSCHSIHKPEPASIVNAKPSRLNELCTQCHANTWAQFQRPYKHRLPEGAMSCVDCHNPHGGIRPRMIQTVNANEPGCIKCHGDKRGPFTFEHAPVKTDGCSACHEPHGSANPRMLVRHEERYLCLECHANVGAVASAKSGTLGGIPPAFHDLRTPRFRNCSVCHTKIHGSYVERALTR